MTEAEKARFRRQCDDLAESETDDPGTVEQRRRALELVNHLRAQIGAAPMPDEDEEPPELGFHRRAKALGMARTRH